jgi:hypothetical protein
MAKEQEFYRQWPSEHEAQPAIETSTRKTRRSSINCHEKQTQHISFWWEL